MHHRVTLQGQALGANAVRLAALGRTLLVSMGLDTVQAPMLRAEMCKSCACRAGPVPNGCEQTQLDFLKAVVEGRPFLCHAPKDGRMCAGWVQARAEIVANPPPAEVVAMLARHDYSPADDEEVTP